MKLEEEQITEIITFYETYLRKPNNGDMFRNRIPTYDVEFIKLLVDAEWDINDSDEVGLHLLRNACERDYLYRLNILFECGLLIEEDSEIHEEIVKIATNYQSILVLKRLQTYFEIPVICKTDGSSLLQKTCADNDFDRVKELVEVDTQLMQETSSVPDLYIWLVLLPTMKLSSI